MSRLPEGIRLLERGWLSSNSVIFLEGETATVVDSGYVSHAEQTVALVRRALEGRRLARLVNTHSHSDHIGGNAALKRAFGCAITIPAGMAGMIRAWDESALLLSSTDQRAERFGYDTLLAAGSEIEMGGLVWRSIAAPGHDMHAVVLYNPEKRLLISGDALWRNGFGVIFAALAGDAEGLRATRRTLEGIARLAVDVVIPGHGPAFVEFDDALRLAFGRLESYEQDGDRLARHAARVMFSFALLEKRRMRRDEVAAYLASVPIQRTLNERYFRQSWDELTVWLLADLQRAGAVAIEGADVLATGP